VTAQLARGDNVQLAEQITTTTTPETSVEFRRHRFSSVALLSFHHLTFCDYLIAL